jgi:hypothetical protein
MSWAPTTAAIPATPTTAAARRPAPLLAEVTDEATEAMDRLALEDERLEGVLMLLLLLLEGVVELLGGAGAGAEETVLVDELTDEEVEETVLVDELTDEEVEETVLVDEMTVEEVEEMTGELELEMGAGAGAGGVPPEVPRLKQQPVVLDVDEGQEPPAAVLPRAPVSGLYWLRARSSYSAIERSGLSAPVGAVGVAASGVRGARGDNDDVGLGHIERATSDGRRACRDGEHTRGFTSCDVHVT